MKLKNQNINQIKNLKIKPYFTHNETELEYFVQYTGSNGFLLILDKEKFYFFTDGRYYDFYSKKMPHCVVLITPEKSIYELVLEILNKHNINELSINYNHFTYSEVLKLRKELKTIKIKKDNDSVQELMREKSCSDINIIKNNIDITEEGLAYIMAFLKEGLSEKEAAIELEYYLKIKGADELSFPAIVLFGENSSFPHGEPGKRKLKKGDVVLIDLGIKKNHLCSDMTRTFVYGSIPEGFSFHYKWLLKIQNSVISRIKGDMKAHILDDYVKKALLEKELEQFYTHSLGHGVGTQVHEVPVLSYKRKKVKLKKRNLFTIEPGIYIPGKYGIRIEDMVYINQYGRIEVLTTFPKELLVKKD